MEEKVMGSLSLDKSIDDWLPIASYATDVPGMPDLLLARFPLDLDIGLIDVRGLDRWKIWIIENESEGRAIDEAFTIPITLRNGKLDFKSGPDYAVSKIHRHRDYGQSRIIVYDPPQFDWPYITLLRMPSVKSTGKFSHLFARGIYAYDISMTGPPAMEQTY